MNRAWGLPACLLIATFAAMPQSPPPYSGWPAYGGDAGGQRYSAANQINRSNVTRLHVAWEYHTKAHKTDTLNRSEAAFEATPILEGDSLFFSTPFDQVISLNASTGAEQWRFDPKLANDLAAGVYTSRGVAYWHGNTTHSACDQRIFVATLDARLIALDASTGTPCAGFGTSGTIDLRKNVPTQTTYPYQEFGATSPPTVVGNLVIVGSIVADGQEVDVEPGLVRAYDALSGNLVWTWDPMPWAQNQKIRTGAGNTWSVISADFEHNLIFLPTGSPSPDFYGSMRPGDDKDADSLVALNASTGKEVWAFQVVHHNLWDYDVAAQPLLFNYQNKIPAIAINTKMGMVFVLNRLTGQPIYPVEERPVPQSDVPGEVSSPTQPFSSLPSLAPLHLRPEDLAGRTPANVQVCSAKLFAVRNEGIYTPPSVRGSLLYPGSLGGVNWGSPAFDPETGIMYVNSNNQAFQTRLIPRWRFQLAEISNSWENWIYAAASLLILLCAIRRTPQPGWVGGAVVIALVITGCIEATRKPAEKQHFGREIAPQRKSPYAVERSPIVDNNGLPCTPTPWGKITALNLNTGMNVWVHPLGTMVKGAETGSLNLGGPMVTEGGLVFAGAVREPVLRAFDKTSGEILWTGNLPDPAQSTPMTYVLNGRQFVVIAAGGHGGFGTPTGDSLVAFALD